MAFSPSSLLKQKNAKFLIAGIFKYSCYLVVHLRKQVPGAKEVSHSP